tara:strand:+ start:71 stop:1105 length:1035 start_codon:yes stop_codon:yes gene_type:complete
MNTLSQEKLWNMYDEIENTFEDSSTKNSSTNEEETRCIKCNFICDFKKEDGYNWCDKCGENNGIIISTEPEWRYYGSEDSKSSDPTRCGITNNNLLYNMSCGTMISSKGNSPEVKRLRTIHKYITSNYNDRAILKIFDDLTTVSTNHNINPIIIDCAKKIYKDIRDVKISRGINRDALIATCLMTSLNINNVSRSQKEIAEIFGINQSHITQSRKKLLELNNYIKNNIMYKINITSPEHFIPRFCSLLQIDKKYIQLMNILSKKIIKLPDISENTPPAIATGIIYFICHLCKLNINKKKISLVCKISEVTINKCFKKLINFTDILISEDIKEKYDIKYKIKIIN